MKLPGCVAMRRDNKRLDFDEEQLNLVKTRLYGERDCKGDCGAELNRFLAGGPKLIYYNR